MKETAGRRWRHRDPRGGGAAAGSPSARGTPAWRWWRACCPGIPVAGGFARPLRASAIGRAPSWAGKRPGSWTHGACPCSRWDCANVARS